ncbi:MAG: hypothetical protein WCB79_02430 [Halobacteriota archaeon]
MNERDETRGSAMWSSTGWRAATASAELKSTRRSYLRTFALELKEHLAQTLAAFVTSILAQPRGRLDAEKVAEPPLRQIIDVLQQVMCRHDAEELAISVLEIYESGSRQGRVQADMLELR